MLVLKSNPSQVSNHTGAETQVREPDPIRSHEHRGYAGDFTLFRYCYNNPLIELSRPFVTIPTINIDYGGVGVQSLVSLGHRKRIE